MLYKAEESLRYINIEMDGVMVDLEGTAQAILGHPLTETKDRRQAWQTLVNGAPNLFLDAKPMRDFLFLMAGIHHLAKISDRRPRVLTTEQNLVAWPEMAIHKKVWISEHASYPMPFVSLSDEAEKQQFAATGQILIDGSRSNIERWVEQGGIGILHRNASDTLERLRQLVLPNAVESTLSVRRQNRPVAA